MFLLLHDLCTSWLVWRQILLKPLWQKHQMEQKLKWEIEVVLDPLQNQQILRKGGDQNTTVSGSSAQDCLEISHGPADTWDLLGLWQIPKSMRPLSTHVPFLLCNARPYSLKSLRERRRHSSSSTWTCSHPCNYILASELFYFLLATGPVSPGRCLQRCPSLLSPPTPPSAMPKGSDSGMRKLRLCKDICSPKQYPVEQITHCCSFRRWVGKRSLEAQSAGAAPPLQMAQLLKCICF